MRIRDKKENNSKSLDHIGVNQYAVILHFHRDTNIYLFGYLTSTVSIVSG